MKKNENPKRFSKKTLAVSIFYANFARNFIKQYHHEATENHQIDY